MKPESDLYSVGDIARLFGLNESRIRYWAQTGFVNPSGSRAGKRLYKFRDLVGIKAAKELLDRGIPLQRVRKNIQALREELPDLDQPLARLRICSDGEHLVVDQQDRTFEPISGQLILDFEVSDLRSQVAKVLQIDADRAPPPTEHNGTVVQTRSAGAPDVGKPTTAYGWFLRACAADSSPDSDDEAISAYRKAIELDPKLAAAYTNLGNLYYQRREREEARRAFETACALEPEQPQARYNLANLHEEEGNLELAIAEYRRAISSEPEFTDAHFNLALALEMVDSRVLAIKHWQKYLDLAQQEEMQSADDPWISMARSHLARLEAWLTQNVDEG